MTKRLRQVSTLRPVLDPPPTSPSDTQNPEVLRAVAANVLRLRTHKGYSQGDLARLSGLPPTLIASVEEALGSPTIKVLWSLATVLGVPFSNLLAREAGSALQVARPAPKPLEASTQRDGVACRSLLSPSRGPRRTELYELKLSRGATRDALLRPAGTRDNILLTSGSAVIESEGVRHLLKTGDSIEVRSDRARTYANVGDGDATLYIVISYPKQVG
jgi:transcriptional regulator with XRE-family HTH domain